MSSAKAAEPMGLPPRVRERFPPSPTQAQCDAVQGFLDGIANLLVNAWWDNYLATHGPDEEESDG